MFRISLNKLDMSLLVLMVVLLSGCGSGGGAESRTGILAPASIAITPASAIVAKGQATHFTATATYTDGSTADITSKVTWVSSNANVAIIDSATGVATGIAGGTISISASSGSVKSNIVAMIVNLIGGAVQGTPLNLTTAVSSFAGSGTQGAADGTGMAASFNYPVGITTDGSNLYVSDTGNNKIRKIVIASGAVTTLAGSGTAGAVDGIGTAASFYYPYGITTDGSKLYVSDDGNRKIRKIQ